MLKVVGEFGEDGDVGWCVIGFEARREGVCSQDTLALEFDSALTKLAFAFQF
jgi:hypothetical protein